MIIRIIHKIILTILLLAFAFNIEVKAQQCQIIPTATEICRGNTITFRINNTASRYEWKSGTGNIETKTMATFIYDTFGFFTVHVTLYNFDNTVKCVDSIRIRVFDLPIAGIIIPDSLLMCYQEEHCFINNSKPGADKAPITENLWVFGDGGISFLENPCHKYAYEGEFLVFINIKDSNNCEAHFEKKVYVKVLPDINPYFTTDYNDIYKGDSCPVTNVFFKNLTDTMGKHIKNFYWDFGDGTYDSNTKFSDFYHLYTKNGEFHPKLIMESDYGCKDSFTCSYCAGNIVFNFDITCEPETLCWKKNEVKFYQPQNYTVSRIYWHFYDKGSTFSNWSGLWSPTHHFSTPGAYDIFVKIEDHRCKMDTTICKMVHILGPKALINLKNRPNSCIKGKPIPLSVFDNANSKCLNPHGDSVEYVSFQKVSPFVIATVDTFCNADTLSYSIDSISACTKDTVYILGPPTSTHLIYDSFKITHHMWPPGEPFPSDPRYPATGICDFQNMHDTDMVVPNCAAPNYVRFTNNSIKYRLYKAMDNRTPFEPGTIGYDQCKNPSYPWASDSMSHFWDFDDPYAVTCVSTKNKPDITCNYSTEVQPWHLYSHDGCFQAMLTVTDSVTGCSSSDSVIISMQSPHAGWDTTAYDYLNFNSQQLYSSLPRRGFILRGLPCVDMYQFPDLMEILPTCFVQDWGLVLDSANDCTYFCIDTTYSDLNGDGMLDTNIHRFDSCDWVTQDIYKTKYPFGFKYDTPGCKTIGLWVQTGDCLDTFWYHDYKYIVELNADFSILYKDTLNGDSLISSTGLAFRSCVPYHPLILLVDSQYQVGIKSFSYDIVKTAGLPGSPPVSFGGDCQIVTDTAYLLCRLDSFVINIFGDTVYNVCFEYPSYSCTNDPLDITPLDTLLKKFIITDTIYLKALTDTLYFKDTLDIPGIYTITSTIRHLNGCFKSSVQEIILGFYTEFWVQDTVVCVNDTIEFKNLISDFRGFSLYPSPYVEWDLDGDSIYETKNVQYPKFIYTKPGIYTVRMRVIDSIGCVQEQLIERKNYIHVVGVEAGFDTLHSPSICAPEVVGFIDTTKFFNQYYYIYDSLGNKTDSLLLDMIKKWTWNFGDEKGRHSISYLQNPKHAYTANGRFDVSLVVQTVQGCFDTMYIEDYIVIDGPRPEFVLLDSIGCVPYTVRVIDSSHDVSSWIWELGDNTQKSGEFNYGDTVELTYYTPGVYYIDLIGTDSVYNPFFGTYTKCSSLYPDPANPTDPKFKVTILPLDEMDFDGDTLICSGEEAYFFDKSDTSYDYIHWYFSDGNDTLTLQGEQLMHIFNIKDYELADTFSVSIDGIGAPCPDTARDINVYVQRVIADIEWDSTLFDDPIFCFSNFSRGGTHYVWDLSGGNPGSKTTDKMATVCTNYLIDKGFKTVCMTATNDIGCKDTDCEEVENTYEVFLHVPNVFTPGTVDGLNDSFIIDTKNIENYHLKVFNRWGVLVFESYDEDYLWDGNNNETGETYPSGVYFYDFDYNFKHLEPKSKHGTVTLIR